MPMKRDEHEALLNELLNPELETSRKTEILQSLRTDYVTVHTEHKELSDTRVKLEKDNADLIVSNSKLFRQIGVTGSESEKEEKQKEYSETVTIEELERV